tara:strand:- start:118 stop:963 length:846 start_codon:yes stop_codon:yes gene_type:complete
MAKKSTKKQLVFLIETWQEGYKSIKTSTAEREGFDVSEKDIEVENFRLIKNELFGGYSLKIIDKNKDLENNLIEENSKALKHLQNIWKQGISEIHSKELHPFSLNTRIGKMTFGNLKLSQSGLSDSYRIELIDKDRGADGKWSDESVDYKKVLKVLQNYKLTKTKLSNSTETKINSELEKHFRKYFENANKSTGKIRGLFDLVVGNMNFVIELKMAKSLKNSGQRQRASGQIKQYLEEFGNKNLMLLVVGSEDLKQDKNIKSLEKEVLKDFKCYYHYVTAV